MDRFSKREKGAVMFDLSRFFNNSATTTGIQPLYTFETPLHLFIRNDIINSYKRILVDVVEKSSGMPDKHEHIWWDSYVQSESGNGLVTLLANAMFNKSELYLVYKTSTGVLRVATMQEQKQIKDDYKKSGSSKAGVYVSFSQYDRTDMMRIYSVLEYCLLHSLHKTMNLSKAVQIKIKGIRASVSAGDSEIAIAQAKVIAEALAKGQEIMLDKEDEVTTTTVDTSPTEKGMDFLEKKKSFILGLPTSYISGDQTPGIGSTGEADMRAVEKGLKQYFFSIIRPVIKDLLGETLAFRSDDFRYITTSLEVLKSFEVTSSELISTETKRDIVCRAFNIDSKSESKKIEKEQKEIEKNRPQIEPPQFNNQEGTEEDEE